MAQASGFGNTAPSPVPGGYGNPAGAQTHSQGAVPLGLPSASPTGIPQAYGTQPVGALPTIPGGTPGSFAANGPSGGTTANLALTNLSSGTSVKLSDNELREFQRAYGKGTGQAIFDMLSKGLFNPQVAQALIAAMQPQINRGMNSVESAFGAEGARFSSAAAIGVGDYQSQAVLGENQVLANLYQNAQTEQLGLLENILPTLHQEQADSQSSGILGDILGGLEIAGGIAAAPFTGGASLGLAGSGVSTIMGANSNGSPSSASGGGIPGLNQTLGKIGTNVWGGNTNANYSVADPNTLLMQNLQSSGANAVGGPPSNQDTGNPMTDQLMQAMLEGNYSS